MTSATREALIIADASPLIGLAKIDRFGLLPALASQVLIPHAVWREVVTAGGLRPEVTRIEQALSSAVVQVEASNVVGLSERVDRGEAEAIALARVNPGCLLLIDDGAGRTLAGEFGVRVIGTAGLLLRARKLGHLTSLAAELGALQQHGLYLRPALIDQLLAAAGESRASQAGT